MLCVSIELINIYCYDVLRLPVFLNLEECMPEKRKNKRKISRTQIKFGNKSCDKTAFTSNLSTKGFYVRTNRAHPPDTILQFAFHLSDGTVVEINGRVIHASRAPSQIARIRRSGMGIEIVDGKDEYLKLLKYLNIVQE